MTLELSHLDVSTYDTQRSLVENLVARIWTRPESLENVLHSLNRWASTGTETGTYFLIKQDQQVVGITGYFIPSFERGEFGLRHHGTTVRGTGRTAIELLFDYLRQKYGTQFKEMIELIPEGREELIPIFEGWGFYRDLNAICNWEPKRTYYKYVMVRKA